MNLTEPQRATLHRNLAVLAGLDPGLHGRLCLAVEPDTADLAADGTAAFRYGRQAVRLDLGARHLAAAVALADGHPAVRLCGAGVGDMATAILADTDATVDLWERDPWLLRLSLARCDWQDALRSGRLRLHLGVDLIDIAGESGAGPVLSHPILRRRYAAEARLLTDGVQARRAVLCAGELFVDDLGEALLEQGWSVYTWEIKRLDVAELRHTLARFQPELAVSINYTTGLAEECARHDLPLVCWEIDPATSFLQPLQAPARGSADISVFTYRAANVSAYRAAGFARVQHLPLAANVVRRRPLTLSAADRERYAAPLSFVGASMVGNARQLAARFFAQHQRLRPHVSPQAVHGLMQQILGAQRQDVCRWMIPEVMEQLAPGLRAEAAAAALDDPAMLLGEVAAAEKRLHVVATLAPLGITAWGDEGWATLRDVLYAGYAGHYEELGKIYSASRVNIDIGRLYQSDIVPMRIFDILAHGGFVIAEHVEGIEALFAPDELVTWRSLAELYAKAEHYLTHPEQAERIAARGRARVLRDHTIRGRLAQMMAEARLALGESAA